MRFTKISTKAIKESQEDTFRLKHGYGIMGSISKFDSKKFCYKFGGSEAWCFIEFGSKSYIQNQIQKINDEFSEMINGRYT
jgi:hypothetical protein